MMLFALQGACSQRRIYDVRPDAFEPMCQYCSDYYWRWEFYLPYFNGSTPTDQQFYSEEDFKGCGGNSVSELNYIEFENKWGPNAQWICFDRIALL
jgi:hypothetical protein